MTSKKTARSPRKRTTKKDVEFSCFAPEAHSLFIAGSFNDWSEDTMPMRRDKDGHWRASVRLSAGCHEYRYVADGHWFSDEQAADSSPNPHGSHNSVIYVE